MIREYHRERCCPDDFGGSHYHCVYCGCVSGMMGHTGPTGPKHFCPPLEKRPEYAERFVWKQETK